MSARAAVGRVLVLGGDTRAFLAVVRSLGRRGIEVEVAGCPPHSPARASRYIRACHALPAHESGADAWCAALVDVLEAKPFDLVIPCGDPDALPLRAHRAELAARAALLLPPEAACRMAFDKGATGALARRVGIPTPREIALDGEVDTASIEEALAPPWVIKPASSFGLGDLEQKRLVRIVRDRGALDDALRVEGAKGGGLVQEFFRGVGVGLEVLAHEGEILFAFQHVREHEPEGGGGSSYRRSAPVDPELLDAARRLLAAVDYSGVAMLEFRRDPESENRRVFLEINARFWGSLPLAVAAGADFPWYAYRLFVHGDREFPAEYRTDLFARNLSLDARWWLARSASGAGLRAEIGRALRGRERNDTFTLDDPRPGLREIAELARAAARRAARATARLALGNAPVRTRLRKRARPALRSARSVLFVCKGNLCRSPFAAARARDRLGADVRIESAGTLLRCGRPSPVEAVLAARELGVELESHRSRALSLEQVAAADAILVFDAENRRAVASEFPGAIPRLHSLAPFAPEGAYAIDDPYGRPLAEYRRVYAEIDRALEAIARLRCAGL